MSTPLDKTNYEGKKLIFREFSIVRVKIPSASEEGENKEDNKINKDDDNDLEI